MGGRAEGGNGWAQGQVCARMLICVCSTMRAGEGTATPVSALAAQLPVNAGCSCCCCCCYKMSLMQLVHVTTSLINACSSTTLQHSPLLILRICTHPTP